MARFNTSLLVMAVFLCGLPAWGQSGIFASPDVSVDLSGTIVSDQQVAPDDLSRGILLESFTDLVDGADVDAYHPDDAAGVLFSTNTTVLIDNGGSNLVAGPEDIIRRSWSGVFSIEFDGSTQGLPSGTNVDAVTRLATGDLVVSFDQATLIGPSLVADDDDLVRFDGVSLSILFDAASVGFDDLLDVDALDEVATDRFAISLDASGVAVPSGVRFDDEDLIEIDTLTGGVIGVLFDASSEHAGWTRADMDAAAVPEPSFLAGVMIGAGLLLGGVCARGRANL